jgi:hypothetical protein
MTARGPWTDAESAGTIRSSHSRSIRRGWLAGFVVGVAAGCLTLEFPSLGWLLAIAFALPAAIVGPRAAAIGGLLAGLGAIWTVLIGHVALTCRAGCEDPGIERWLIAGGGLLAAGLALSAIAAWRRRR